MTALSAAQPLPPATPMPDGYPRHNPPVDEQRSVLHGLVDAQPWPKQSWEDLIEELLALGRADVALARLAEGHIDALRILDQAGCTPEPDALYGVWASRSQQTGVRARRTDSGGLELTGTLSFASGAGLLDRALIPVWPTEDIHLLVDLSVADLPVDTTLWRTAAMAATRTHRVMIESLLVEPADQVGGDAFYLSRPGFFPGGVGMAACWVGGAARVADLEPLSPDDDLITVAAETRRKSRRDRRRRRRGQGCGLAECARVLVGPGGADPEVRGVADHAPRSGAGRWRRVVGGLVPLRLNARGRAELQRRPGVRARAEAAGAERHLRGGWLTTSPQGFKGVVPLCSCYVSSGWSITQNSLPSGSRSTMKSASGG